MPWAVISVEKINGLRRIESWLVAEALFCQNWRKPGGTMYRVLDYGERFSDFSENKQHVALLVNKKRLCRFLSGCEYPVESIDDSGVQLLARFLILGDERDKYMNVAQLPNRLLALRIQLPY